MDDHPLLREGVAAVLEAEGDILIVGEANKEIARDLSLSEDTVKGLMRSIFSKLGVTDRTQAVTVGHRRGVIQL